MFEFQSPVDRMQISQDARYVEQNIWQSDTQTANSSNHPTCLPLKNKKQKQKTMSVYSKFLQAATAHK